MKDEIFISLQKASLKISPEFAGSFQVTKPQDSQHGDWSSNIALIMAKEMKKNPRELAVEIDNFVDISVKDTDPGLKGDTATNTFKPAILENGIEIKVPLFISPGDFISVDTRSMEYQGRVNK